MPFAARLIVVSVLGFASSPAGAGILYVDDDAPPGGDGLSWNTALASLHDALVLASDRGNGIDEIRVAQGLYLPEQLTPDGGTDCCVPHAAPGCSTAACEDIMCSAYPSCCSGPWTETCVQLAEESCGALCTATFQLVNGVAVRGGYAGPGAADPDARDPDAFPSVLSGDVAGDDADAEGSCCSPSDTPGCPSGACEAIVCAELPSCCDTAWDLLCAAIAATPFYGCELLNACPEIADNTIVVNGSFTDASALLEGFTVTRGAPGILIRQGAAAISDCAVAGNAVEGLVGSGSEAVITGCTFSDNAAGGLHALQSTPDVSDCAFAGNAGYFGGAVFVDGFSTVSGCSFSGNRALNAGGMYLRGGEVLNCGFTGNDAPESGGGLWISGDARAIGCTFQDNAATQYGGGLIVNPDIDDPDLTLVANSLFAGNSAGRGAGVFIAGEASPFLNCTFAENTATIGGGGHGGLAALMANCVLWGNVPDQIESVSALNQVEYCDVQGGFPGVGNVDADPLWVDPAGRDYRLQPGSPCIDAGWNQAYPHRATPVLPCDTSDLDQDGDTLELIPYDLDGRARFHDDRDTPDTGCAPGPNVDMGAFEFGAPAAGPRVLYFDLDGDGAVTVLDLLIVLAEWGPCDSPCCPADFGRPFMSDGRCRLGLYPDGESDLAELSSLLDFWGQ